MPERPSTSIVDVTDERGASVGTEDLLRAHQGAGRLHRAFSIFVFNSRGETLLQRRSPAKRTFPGLWSNACCSHPRPGWDLRSEADRRLQEEMGFTVPVEEVGRFTYRAEDPASGLIEHEYDHVLIGWFDGVPEPDPSEVSEWAWTALADLEGALASEPERYTPWLKQALETVRDR